MPVNINPIEAHPVWAIAHVGKEVFERVPAFADRYASRAVVFVVLALCFSASPEHVAPSNILGAPSSTLLRVTVADVAVLAASARSGVSGPQGFSRNDAPLSAIAIAKPKNVMAAERGMSSDKPPKPLTRDIDGFGHRSLSEGCLSSGGIGAASTDLAAHPSTGA